MNERESRPTIAATLPQSLIATLRERAARARRPLSWEIEMLLQAGLRCEAEHEGKAA